MRNEWQIYSYSMPTTTLISYATWVILLGFPRQHDDDAPLLLVTYHEIFMASFVCLFVQTTEVSQFRPPSSPSPAFIFFYLASRSPCSAQAVQVTSSSCEKSLSYSLLNTGIFPMLTADWNSWPFPLFSSVLTQILRNTNFLCNLCNQTISQGIHSTNLY